MSKLKPYAWQGSDFGFLIIATDESEARKLGLEQIMEHLDPIDLEGESFYLYQIRDGESAERLYKLADQSLLSQGVPHAIFTPASCKVCDWWGAGVDEKGHCLKCNAYAGDELNKLYNQIAGGES